MKKLLIMIAGLIAGFSLTAQQKSSTTPAASMSVAEANRLNGNAEPVYQNGKPYTQWVAEENAKRQQPALKNQPAKQNTAPLADRTITIADAKPAPAKTEVRKPVLATEAEVQQYVKENTKPVADKEKAESKPSEPTVPSRLAGTAATQADYQELNKRVEQPVVTASAPAAKVKADDAAQTNSGNARPANALTIGTVSDMAPLATAPVNSSKMPDVKLNQEAQKTEAEIPASVAPKPIKVPEASKQGGGN